MRNTNFIWLDLEMTGLELEKDVILEIATVITDDQLNVVAEGPNIAIHQPTETLENMNAWCRNQHSKSGLTTSCLNSIISVAQAEQQTLDFVMQHCKQKAGILCGNSIWQDRNFLQKYMPNLTNHLHYKMIDVTSVQQILKAWHPDNQNVEFKKQELHRALPDVYESIAELKHYKNNFFTT